MKGYLVTPVIFVAMFLIAAGFMLNSSSITQSQEKAITQELELLRAENQYHKKMIACGTRAYEELEYNPTANITLMEQRIQNRILANEGIQTTVTLTPSLITITPANYLITTPNSQLNYTGKAYKVART